MQKTLLVTLFVTCIATLVPATEVEETIDPGVDNILQRFHSLGRFDGAILVARGDTILHARGYGLANIELSVKNTVRTNFDIGSLSKQFTAAAIVLLHQQGQLELHTPISTYLPDYPNPQGEKVTIHHLLTHTSGIPSIGRRDGLQDIEPDGDPISLDALIEHSSEKPLQFEPGSEFRYNNTAYAILAKIITVVSGKPYSQFLHQELFAKTGMTDTMVYRSEQSLIPNRATGYIGFNGSQQRAPFTHPSWSAAGGGIRSSALDLYRWYRALENKTILDAEHTALLFQQHSSGTERYDYGYGWFLFDLYDMPIRNHGGTTMGFVNEFTIIPERDLFIVALTNHLPELGINQPWAVTRAVAAHLSGKQVDAPPVISPAVRLSEHLAGRYSHESGLSLVISVENGKPFIEPGDEQPWSPLDIRNVASLQLSKQEKQTAAEILEAIISGDHPAFIDTLTQRMAEIFDEERFSEMSDRLTSQLGADSSWAIVEARRNDDISSYAVQASGEEGSKLFNLVLDSEGRLAGLFTQDARPIRMPIVATGDGRWLVDGFRWKKPDLLFTFEQDDSGITMIIPGDAPLHFSKR